MRICKRIKAEIPTVQYGNVEIETSLEWETTVDGDPSREHLLYVQKVGKVMDRIVRQEYVKFHQEMENEVERITKFVEGKQSEPQKQSRKEAIKSLGKRRSIQ